MDDLATTTSPTRKYLAICLDENRNLSLRKFSIPELFDGSKLENDSSMATWYFVNLLDVDATTFGCIALEDVEAAPWFNLADVRENPLLMRVSADELEADAD